MAYEVELKARLNQPEEIEAEAARLGRLEGETFKQIKMFPLRGSV